MEEQQRPRRRGGVKHASVPAALGAVGITLVGGLLGTLLRGRGRKKQASTKATSEKTLVEASPVVKEPAAKPPVETAAAAPAAEPVPATPAAEAPVAKPAAETPPPAPVVDELEAAAARAEAAAAPAAGANSQTPVPGVDLSPFGSPVGSTPVRLPGMRPPRASSAASTDGDDASDNASLRDQRGGLVDAAQLQRTLKQMQEMAEENRRLSQFLSEYKADAEKLSKLEAENRALRDVTRQLESELQEIKHATLPRTGAELEVFKNSVHVPVAARSVCSNDESVVLGLSTASVDGTNPETRVRRASMFRQLLSHLQGPSSAASSQPVTPRSTAVSGGGAGVSGGGASVDGAASSGGGWGRTARRQPRPEEAAAIGQAVYQLLDSFGGRML